MAKVIFNSGYTTWEGKTIYKESPEDAMKRAIQDGYLFIKEAFSCGDSGFRYSEHSEKIAVPFHNIYKITED